MSFTIMFNVQSSVWNEGDLKFHNILSYNNFHSNISECPHRLFGEFKLKLLLKFEFNVDKVN